MSKVEEIAAAVENGKVKKVAGLVQEALDEANRRLANRRIMLRNAGSIAEAFFGIPEWLEQKAFDYFDNEMEVVYKRFQEAKE